jgi:hypothetical protein
MDIKSPKKENNVCRLEMLRNGELFSFLDYKDKMGERFWECPYVFLKCSDIYVNIQTGETHKINPMSEVYVYIHQNAHIQF